MPKQHNPDVEHIHQAFCVEYATDVSSFEYHMVLSPCIDHLLLDLQSDSNIHYICQANSVSQTAPYNNLYKKENLKKIIIK